MCVPGCAVEVKLLCNFSKIAKICNTFPNKGPLLNRSSWTRSYECNSFTNSHYTLVSPPSFWGIQNQFEKQPQCIWTRIAFDGKLQRRVTRISERIDFTPNETKEVSLQKQWVWLFQKKPVVALFCLRRNCWFQVKLSRHVCGSKYWIKFCHRSVLVWNWTVFNEHKHFLADLNSCVRLCSGKEVWYLC